MFGQIVRKLRDTANAIAIIGERIGDLETVSIYSIYMLLAVVIRDFVEERIPFFGYGFAEQWLAVADVMENRANTVGKTADAMSLETPKSIMSVDDIHPLTLMNTMVSMYNTLIWVTSKQRWDFERDADSLTIGERYKVLHVMTLKAAAFLGKVPNGYGAKRVLYAISQDLHSLQLQAGEPDYDVTHDDSNSDDSAFSH